jgi:hypothetical protein
MAAVSKDGQPTECSFPPVETHRCAMLLRVRWFGSMPKSTQNSPRKPWLDSESAGLPSPVIR